MNRKLIFESNLSLLQHIESISGELDRIIKPLFQNLQFSHFSYYKVFKNGQYLTLSNDLRIVQSYLQHKISCNNGYFFENKRLHVPLNSCTKSFWPIHDKKVPGVSLFHELGMSHGINVVHDLGDYVEGFVFAAPIECEQVNDIYLNHFYILERFIVYFKKELENLIDINDKKLFACSPFYKKEIPKLFQTNLGSFKQKFFKNTEIDKFYLEKHPQTYLTKKETECLYYLCLGKSAKEISSILNTSHRTIEKHFENVKMKCNLSFLNQVIDLCRENWVNKLHLLKFGDKIL